MARTRSPKTKTENSDVLNAGAETADQAMTAQAMTGSAVAQTARPEAKRRARTNPNSVLMPGTIEEEIRRRAYELYEGRGYSNGHETEDWLVAEQEVLQRYRQHHA